MAAVGPVPSRCQARAWHREAFGSTKPTPPAVEASNPACGARHVPGTVTEGARPLPAGRDRV